MEILNKLLGKYKMLKYLFALTGSANFDEASGSACTEGPDDSGLIFMTYVQSASLDNDPSSDNYGMLTTQVCNMEMKRQLIKWCRNSRYNMDFN